MRKKNWNRSPGFILALILLIILTLYIKPSYADLGSGINLIPGNFPVLPITTDISGHFTDSRFKQVVWEWLGKTGTPGKITIQDITGRLPAKDYSLTINRDDVTSLAGLEYFSGLEKLSYMNGNLSHLPALPSSLKQLLCSGNQLSSLPPLPSGLEALDCSDNVLNSLPALPNSLRYLDCYGNDLASLPSLPSNLKTLDCGANWLSNLPTLSSGLESLYCDGNQLSVLPALPNSLKGLNCRNNLLENLPILPENIKNLHCEGNQLSNLPILPSGLAFLYCERNHLQNLPLLPASLVELHCAENRLTNLPTLPGSLKVLDCSKNYLDVFSDPLKIRISLSSAPQKKVTPQYRLKYTGGDFQVVKGETKQMSAYNLKIQATSDSLTWQDVGNADLSAVKFSSSNQTVASVNSSGLITGWGVGTCRIFPLLDGVDSPFTKTAVNVSVLIQLPGGTIPGTIDIPGNLNPSDPLIPIPGGPTNPDDPEPSQPSDPSAELKILMTIDSPTAFINSSAVRMDVPPIIINNRTMVPFRFISEAFGAEVEWLEESRTVVVKLTGQEIRLIIGQLGPGLDVPAQIVNDRTLVPLRYISESLGGNVQWFPETRSIEITK